MLEQGDLIDIWVVERKAGSGGMGSVYRCHNQRATRILAAIKVLETGLRREGSDAEARFIREAEILFALDHPNIVKVRNVRIDHDPPYIEMEFVQGQSLEALLRYGAMEPAQAMDLMGQLAGALRYLHAQGIRHRDVKPANVLVQGNGVAKLVDFGLAIETQGTRLTQAGMTFGTVSYAPPEWIKPDSLDPVLWDIYALGVMYWEMLTGQVAFPVSGKGSARQQAMAVIVAKQAHDPLDPGEGFTSELRALIRSMTEPEPSARPASMAEVAQRLSTAGVEVDSPQAGNTLVALPSLEPFRTGKHGQGSDTWMMEELDEATQETPRRGAATPKLHPRRSSDEPTVELRGLPESLPEAPPARSPWLERLGLAAVLLVLGMVALVVCGGVAAKALWPADEPVDEPVVALPTPPEPVNVSSTIEVVTQPDPAPSEATPTTTPTTTPPVQHPTPAETQPAPAPEPPEGTADEEPPAPTTSASATGQPITRAQFATWLADHPEWQPQEAVAAGRADAAYLSDWSEGQPPAGTEGQFMVNVSWYAAAAYCAGRGGLASLDAQPHTWAEGAEGPPLEHRQLEGGAAFRAGDGTSSDKVKGRSSNAFTGFRCAR